jgi:hypothetical protein
MQIIYFLLADRGIFNKEKVLKVKFIKNCNFTLIDTIFSPIYTFTGEKETLLGITHCAPLNKDDREFIGAICNDLIPTSAHYDESYIEKFYFPENKLNYLFYSREVNNSRTNEVILVLRRLLDI